MLINERYDMNDSVRFCAQVLKAPFAQRAQMTDLKHLS
jgi:hypothetical protein